MDQSALALPPRRTRNAKAGQNGSQLPLLRDEQLSTDELLERANRHHAAFGGAIRTAIVEHARVAGEALNILKRRTDRGDWQEWLRANFRGSLETARVYMRIADSWETIVQNGWDDENLTLQELRKRLGEKGEPTSGTQAGQETHDRPKLRTIAQSDSKNGQQHQQEQEEKTPQPPPKIVTLHFKTREQRKTFERMVQSLKKRFSSKDHSDAIVQAVEFCCSKEGNDG